MKTGGGVDFHTHLAPALDHSRLEEFGVVEHDGRYLIDETVIGPSALYQPESLVKYLDEMGLSSAAVSPSPPFFRQTLDAEHCARWVRGLNDGIVKAAHTDPRLLPLIYLPLEHPDIALDEYRHFRGHPSAMGWAGCAGGRSVPLDSPRLDELWSGMNATQSWLFLHPGSSPDARLDRYYLRNTIGNPFESTLAVGELVFGDVLFRHPNVRFLIAHCGGAFPSLVGRWQRAFDMGRPGAAGCGLEPVAAARRLYVDTVAHGSATLDIALSVVGRDKVVLGSDWPYQMGVDNPLEEIASLPPEVRESVCGDNAGILLGRTNEAGSSREPTEPTPGQVESRNGRRW